MAEPAFTEERARAVLGAAVPDLRYEGVTARLLALGENAVFAVDRRDRPNLVVRISRDADDAAWDRVGRELRVAEWLAAEGLPTVRRSLYSADQPLPFYGHLVTYWEQLPPPVRPAGPRELAALLQMVHALPAPPFALPRRDLLGGVERWLRRAGDAIDPADAAYLRARRDDFAAAAAELTGCLPPGPIHGDALPRNVHAGPDGPVLVDLETFSSDLREHDLVVMALSLDRYGLDRAAYDDFTAAYGWDVREWDGCAVLRGARETASCAWVAQHAPGNPAALAEFRRRVASLREGDPTVRWYPF
ncbi:aminoglycoside phosphotransferase family protein [Streptomyces sp. XD-27]|uniref:aminoglycoside phosphotransferase family protein n=1 Tax=Streptomyces sp. XD-27 TaxID=3062779 RepID=UPI0026F4693B|nr:aminoglycoside phosphotransferase family protein [Streptomyces sp. XD-27]WKX73114.1 aminoglycoside phosphotransferase family protein [Streptomyces sp. XD-27]